MGSFSIWHWLILAIFALGIFAAYLIARRRPAASGETVGPSGVGGWLLLLVAGLMILGPLLGAARLNGDIISTESQYPNLLTLDKWKTFKSATWLTYACVAAISFYGGWGLARGRDFSVVSRAKVVLWIVGPGAALIMGLLLPLLIFGSLQPDPQFIGGFIASVVVAAIWTAYLSRSKRVRATYGLPQVPKAEA